MSSLFLVLTASLSPIVGGDVRIAVRVLRPATIRQGGPPPAPDERFVLRRDRDGVTWIEYR